MSLASPSSQCRWLLWGVLLSVLLAPNVMASEDVVQRVQQFLYERASKMGDEVQIEVRPPSAQLDECVAPEPFLANENSELAGRVSVGVRCGDDGQQVRYMRANVEIIGDHVVPRQDIAPNTVIKADMLETQETELGSLPRDAIVTPEQAIGQEAARMLSSGEPFTERQLREVALVERGARVKVEARGEGFSVSRKGEAIDSGGMGSKVRVRMDNRDTLTARVTGEDHLEVDLQ